MKLLTQYDEDLVLRHHFHNKETANYTLKKVVSIYWRNRHNNVAKSRIKSAIKILRKWIDETD